MKSRSSRSVYSILNHYGCHYRQLIVIAALYDVLVVVYCRITLSGPSSVLFNRNDKSLNPFMVGLIRLDSDH